MVEKLWPSEAMFMRRFKVDFLCALTNVLKNAWAFCQITSILTGLHV